MRWGEFPVTLDCYCPFFIPSLSFLHLPSLDSFISVLLPLSLHLPVCLQTNISMQRLTQQGNVKEQWTVAPNARDLLPLMRVFEKERERGDFLIPYLYLCIWHRGSVWCFLFSFFPVRPSFTYRETKSFFSRAGEKDPSCEWDSKEGSRRECEESNRSQ